MEKTIQNREEKPLISVIVPVYNGQDYLENCIISIENQTYDNLEIIIINDGSTDRTEAICVKLKEKYDLYQRGVVISNAPFYFTHLYQLRYLNIFS